MLMNTLVQIFRPPLITKLRELLNFTSQPCKNPHLQMTSRGPSLDAFASISSGTRNLNPLPDPIIHRAIDGHSFKTLLQTQMLSERLHTTNTYKLNIYVYSTLEGTRTESRRAPPRFFTAAAAWWSTDPDAKPREKEEREREYLRGSEELQRFFERSKDEAFRRAKVAIAIFSIFFDLVGIRSITAATKEKIVVKVILLYVYRSWC